MLKRTGFTFLVVVLSTLLIFACKPKNKEAANENQGGSTTAKAKYVSKGDEGGVSGTVKFDGTPPAAKRIDMGQDANCSATAGEKMTEEYVVNDGKLENVFVYVKGGPVDSHSFDSPSEAVQLDQLGCRYHPHVFGLMTQQTLRITNSDKTTHNIHPSPKVNPEWNEVQSQGAPPKDKTFNRSEVLIPVKCNQHPWMKAYIGVLAHPFYATTDKDGKYTVKGLPPGDYTLVAWHEGGGPNGQEQTAKITIGPKDSKTQDFTFKAGQAYAPSSMEVAPALILP
jgi:carboxypeptidase family protein